MESLIAEARRRYHKSLLEEGVLSIDGHGIPSNADSSSRLSVAIAKGIADRLMAGTGIKAFGQTSGAKFEQINMRFLAETFPKLGNLRPGNWHVVKLGNRSAAKNRRFAQYDHLRYLESTIRSDKNLDKELAASIGNIYMVASDIVIYRDPIPDDEINRPMAIVENGICSMADIRAKNGGLPIMHASVSVKWTLRSDRAQNSRTEALGLIRNRKGHLPHIVVVTGEPMPGRLASLALGTGDIDCMYHFALYELDEAVKATDAEDSIQLLDLLIKGKRLKDISDLPLDLAV